MYTVPSFDACCYQALLAETKDLESRHAELRTAYEALQTKHDGTALVAQRALKAYDVLFAQNVALRTENSELRAKLAEANAFSNALVFGR